MTTFSFFGNGQSNPLGQEQGGWQNWPSNVTAWNNENNVGDTLDNLGDSWLPLDVTENPFVDEANSYCATSVGAVAEPNLSDPWQYLNSSRGSIPFYKVMGTDGTSGPDYRRAINVISAATGLKLPSISCSTGRARTTIRSRHQDRQEVQGTSSKPSRCGLPT